MKKTYTQSAEEVLRDLGVGAEGLTSAQAQERLAKYGPNKLKEAEKPTLLQRFIAQLKDPMLIILLIAAGVSALTGMLAGESEWAEVIIILAVVLLNAILGVVQESKAEAAIEALIAKQREAFEAQLREQLLGQLQVNKEAKTEEKTEETAQV